MFTTNPVINIRPNLHESAPNGVTNTVEEDIPRRAQGMLLNKNGFSNQIADFTSRFI